jgi:IS30 family transposase
VRLYFAGVFRSPKEVVGKTLPKGSFENITDDEVEAVMHKLNHRPRKILNFKTPHEVLFAEPGRETA